MGTFLEKQEIEANTGTTQKQPIDSNKERCKKHRKEGVEREKDRVKRREEKKGVRKRENERGCREGVSQASKSGLVTRRRKQRGKVRCRKETKICQRE